MSEWPILSTVTFLPLIGALLVLVIRGDDAIARRNIFNVALWTTTVTFILSIFINLGMWYERFVIIVPSLSHEFEPWQWSSYLPSWVDTSILIGSFGWFFMWFLLFIKQLPVVAIAEVKEIVPPKMKHAAGHGGHH